MESRKTLTGHLYIARLRHWETQNHMHASVVLFPKNLQIILSISIIRWFWSCKEIVFPVWSSSCRLCFQTNPAEVAWKSRAYFTSKSVYVVQKDQTQDDVIWDTCIYLKVKLNNSYQPCSLFLLGHLISFIEFAVCLLLDLHKDSISILELKHTKVSLNHTNIEVLNILLDEHFTPYMCWQLQCQNHVWKETNSFHKVL